MRKKFEQLKTRIKNQKGFTLIELMATLAILALIIAIAVPAVGNIVEKAKDSSAKANVEMVENAAEIAHIAGYEGAFTAKALATGGYLKVEPNPGVDGELGTADDTYDFDEKYTLAKVSNSGSFKATAIPKP